MTPEETLPPNSMSKTSIALHNLRGFVILIVIAFHSFLAYLAWQPSSPVPFDSPPYHWKAIPISDSERWFGFDLFCASQYVYLMQFMFFLSGLFVWPSFRRKGASSFVYDRALRLGVPFLFGVCVLMPLAHYPVYRVGASDPSWSAYWTHWVALPFWPTGPMWFLSFLLALNIVAAGLFCVAPHSGEHLGRLSAAAAARPGRYFIALLAVSALAYIPLSSVFKPWDWVQFGPFAFPASFSLLYVAYFFAGLSVGAYGLERGLVGSGGMLARRWRLWTAAAFGGLLAWIIPTALVIGKPAGTVSSSRAPRESWLRSGFRVGLLCFGSCIFAFWSDPLRGIPQPFKKCLWHLSGPLRFRDLVAIPPPRNCFVCGGKGGDRVHCHGDFELG